MNFIPAVSGVGIPAGYIQKYLVRVLLTGTSFLWSDSHLLPIPCQSPVTSALACYLCCYDLLSVVRKIGKQREFTWKKVFYVFFL